MLKESLFTHSAPTLKLLVDMEHFYVNAYVYAYMQEYEVSIYLSTVTLLQVHKNNMSYFWKTVSLNHSSKDEEPFWHGYNVIYIYFNGMLNTDINIMYDVRVLSLINLAIPISF